MRDYPHQGLDLPSHYIESFIFPEIHAGRKGVQTKSATLLFAMVVNLHLFYDHFGLKRNHNGYQHLSFEPLFKTKFSLY